MRGRRWHKRHPNRHFIVSVYATRHRVQVDLWTHSWVWERPVKWALDPMQAGRRREATQEYRSRGFLLDGLDQGTPEASEEVKRSWERVFQGPPRMARRAGGDDG